MIDTDSSSSDLSEPEDLTMQDDTDSAILAHHLLPAHEVKFLARMLTTCLIVCQSMSPVHSPGFALTLFESLKTC